MAPIWSHGMLTTLHQRWTLCVSRETLRRARQKLNRKIEEFLGLRRKAIATGLRIERLC